MDLIVWDSRVGGELLSEIPNPELAEGEGSLSSSKRYVISS
jgi:hypothetical protein